MAIISANDTPGGNRYTNSQFRYAMIYVLITLMVLMMLNVYCSKASQTIFYQSKHTSMIEKCQLAADEIAKLEIINPITVAATVEQLGSLRVNRLIVTDPYAVVIYDSLSEYTGSYALLPEILQALDCNDVFFSQYTDGAIKSRAASPVVSYGTTIGCVYMTEYDNSQGALIQSLQHTVFQVTLVLEVVLIFFSIFFASRFSRRMRRIMASMRIIQQGDYTHKVVMGGRDELTFLGKEFNNLSERLQTSENKRRRFVSDASHELKTPLASIKLLADSILQNDMDADTMREFVGDIGDEAERLNRMTAKLLSLTKVDADPEAECEIITMAPTVERVVRMLEAHAAQNEITIETDLSGDCPILMQEDDLYQITFNLVENGIKYNMPGGKLFITLRREEDNACMIIADTGMGIPADAIEHIFERFYRVDKARARASGGSGLGLAIVRAIVQRNRGDIRVESVPEQGSTFTVTFPIFDTEEEDA